MSAPRNPTKNLASFYTRSMRYDLTCAIGSVFSNVFPLSVLKFTRGTLEVEFIINLITIPSPSIDCVRAGLCLMLLNAQVFYCPEDLPFFVSVPRPISCSFSIFTKV